jgi:hypothetical protein
VLLGLIEERHDAEDPGAVDDDVHAPVRLDGEVDQLLRGGLRAAVGGIGGDPLAVQGELITRGIEHGLAAAVQDDLRALLEEPARGRLADATASARYQHYLVLEPHLTTSFFASTIFTDANISPASTHGQSHR